MRAYLLFIIVFAIHYSVAFAQLASLENTGTKYKPYIPSWDTYEFMKYGNVGASLYTGTINYSIPIYKYEDEDFSYGISIDYATNGFRVNHKSGFLGHGWSLNSPGMITREIRGLADDDAKTIIAKGGNGCQLYGYDRTPIGRLNSCILVHYAGNEAYMAMSDANNTCYDTQPDIYRFNFCGYSGSFRRLPSSDGKSFLFFDCPSKSKSLKIESLMSDNIVIIDGLGYKYSFIIGEYTKSTYSEAVGAPLERRIRQWNLQKITAPNGRAMEFIYSHISDNGGLDKSDHNVTYTPSLSYVFSYYAGMDENYGSSDATIYESDNFSTKLTGIKFPDVLNVVERKGISIGDIAIPQGSEIILKPVTQMTLQYSAGHVYRNGTLERVNNSYGYWADSSFHYNILDYQGNVRAVIAENGTLEEVNNYYPYGGLMGAANSGVQPLKYGAKELDRENVLDWYDSKARFYGSMIGRTPTQDPLAEKYSGVSPYLWCAGNPIRFIDEKGDSIAVLYLPGIVGHLALLIQNDNGKWAYYSMNGTKVYKKTSGGLGGKNYHDLGTKTFDSPMAFLNSSYNQEGKNKRDIQDDKVNNYGYEEAFVISTTQKQDKKIREKFLNETHQSYNLVNRQCAQVVQKALNAGGIKTTILEYLYFDDSTPTETVPYMPSSTFRAIRYNYPNGIYMQKK